MKIGFLQVYNEIDWISPQIDQDLKLCDKLIIIEGSQFKSFNKIPERSTDGTLDIISDKMKAHRNIVLLQSNRSHADYRVNQAANFNKALEYCKIGDYFLPFDADEFLLDSYFETINSSMAEGRIDYLMLRGINFAFSMKWNIAYNGESTLTSQTYFKKNKGLNFLPTHTPNGFVGERYIDHHIGFLHFKWVKPKERFLIRHQTSGRYGGMEKWAKTNWDKIELKEGMRYDFYNGYFELSKYHGEYPKLLKDHRWINVEDIRKEN